MITNNFEPQNIVNDSIKAFGLSLEMETEVTIIRDIIHEMNIDDFQTSYLPMKTFFNEVISKPIALGPLLSRIRRGLVDRSPAVLEFADLALKKNWFTPSEYVLKSVHVAFILEAITVAMCNSRLFFSEYVDHVRMKEKEIGIDGSHIIRSFIKTFPASLNFFGSTKAMSLDIAMVYFRLKKELGNMPVTRQSIDKLYNAGKISFLEHKLLMPICDKDLCICNEWLRINIYEAGVTEYKNGFKKNAMSAHTLSEDVLKSCHRESFEVRKVYPKGEIDSFYHSLGGNDNYFPVVSLREDWVNLYLTWNMAFILGELNNLHYLFPKLLIPSVLCSESENFLGARIISLWLSINNSLFLNFNNNKKFIGPKKRKEMAQAWGEINSKYAKSLFESHIDSDPDAFSKSFEKSFSRPYINLFKLILNFFRR